jgi:CRP/FNR family transcriptional regulator
VPLRKTGKTAPSTGKGPQQGKQTGAGLNVPDNMEDLRRIKLFQSLTDDELRAVWSKIVYKEFKKSQVILHEQDSNEYMYIIVRGKVKIVRITDDGKEMILALHSAGDFFGEIALVDGATAPATVTALEQSMVAIISRNDFYIILRMQPKIVDNLLNILCTRLRESWEKIQMLTFYNAADRVKLLLLMLADHMGEKTPRGTVLPIKLIHQDIADMTGLTRETVTRVLDRYTKNGEIEILSNKRILLTPDFETITL